MPLSLKPIIELSPLLGFPSYSISSGIRADGLVLLEGEFDVGTHAHTEGGCWKF